MHRVLLGAGLGGILPSLCTLAASYSSNPTQPMPGFQVGLALVLFFAIGVAVAYGLEETTLKKAFVLGVAGPAVVSSIMNGVSNSRTAIPASPNSPPTGHLSGALFGISDALAQSPSIGGAAPSIVAPAPVVSTSHLTVSPTITGVGTVSQNTTLVVRFLANDGNALSDNAVSAVSPATLLVPAGAVSVQVAIGGVVRTSELPSAAFQSARLDISIVAQPSKDFLWALGGRRDAAVSDLSISLSDIKPIPQVRPRLTETTVLEILQSHQSQKLYIKSVGSGIPQAKLEGALNSRSTSRPDGASVIGLLDATVRGSATLHLLFTSDGMYFKTSSLSRKGAKEGYVAYEAFPHVEFKKAAFEQVGFGSDQWFDVSGSGMSVADLVNLLNDLKKAVVELPNPGTAS